MNDYLKHKLIKGYLFYKKFIINKKIAKFKENTIFLLRVFLRFFFPFSFCEYTFCVDDIFPNSWNKFSFCNLDSTFVTYVEETVKCLISSN